jgi:hypothetical protein
MTRYTEIVRNNDSAKEYAYRFETSETLREWEGDGDSHLKLKLMGPKLGEPPNLVNGSNKLYGYKAIVGCSKVGVGEPFVIVIQAEYKDAFLKRESWWAGMIVSDKMKRSAMRIVFPSKLPFQNPSFRRYPNGSRLESVTFESTAINVGYNPELLWTVSPPVKGSTYRVNWDWYPQPKMARGSALSFRHWLHALTAMMGGS